MQKITHGRVKPLIGISVFFVALALIGLLTIRDYGAPFDEYVEISILKANLKEYALRLAPPTEHNYYKDLNEIRISDNIERDHGISGYYPLAAILPRIAGDARAVSLIWSVLTWCWFMLGCVSLYAILRMLDASRPIASIGVLLLYLSPRFFSEGHYNNKDVVLLCFVLFTLWMGARLLMRPGYLRGVIFSLAGALATNTKIVGVFPWGLVGMAMIVLLTVNHRWTFKMFRIALVTVLCFITFYFLLTPAAWNDPWAFVNYLMANASNFSRFGGIIVFRGAQFYDLSGETPLPWYYLPYYILVTVPLYTLALAVVGQVSVLRRSLTRFAGTIRDPKTLLLWVASLTLFVPLGYAMLTKPLLYNGWRHFYFTFAGLLILGGHGLNIVWKLVRQRKMLRTVSATVLVACLSLTILGLAINHPFQYAYFNLLQPRDARRTMELDYWNVSDSGAFLKLYALRKDRPGPIKVGCYFNDITVGALKLPDAVNDRLVITVNEDEQYLYYNATFAYIYGVKEPPDGYHVVFSNLSYGNTIGTMYEKD